MSISENKARLKSLKDEIRVFPTYRSRKDDFGLFVDTRTQESLTPEQNGFSDTKYYISRIEIGVSFSCNDAEKRMAADIAERRLLRFIYSEQVAFIDEIRAAVYSGNKQQVLDLLCELETTMTTR